ncbi:amidohydrolase [Nocardioides alkalitolerans]|uniref:amidohydrolase n=1 Tax=Nocardioides alkalitolerans TaxID=281714 RepID=UPI000418C881|nr:amidohydrolase [Nocardioides alkalitolerans]
MTDPDLVFIDAQVHDHPQATSVAVRDGRIEQISSTSLAHLAGPRTEVIDAAGATLLPGFVDAHVHPMAAGVQLMTCNLADLPHDLGRYLDRIDSYAKDHPEAEWIAGNGWYGDTFPGGLPTRQQLDSVIPDRPAVLVSHDGHGVWANSRALERAGIDERTPDPPLGRINRDRDGRATGVLVERAGDLVTGLLPPITDQELDSALLTAQAYLHRFGVTSWQDALVGPLWGMADPLDVYLRLADRGELTARVVGALWWEAAAGLEQIDGLLDKRERSRRNRFRATSVKIMQDGVCENCTGAMLNPYSGNPAHDTPTGISFIDPDELAGISRALSDHGFQIHMHAVGDRAVRECLDALESVGPAGAERRHQIAHLDVVDRADIPRFAELDVIANIQALWARRDREIVERKLPLLGTERERQHFPFGDLYRSGARFAMGSDWPVTDPNPLWAIYTAVTRTAPPGDPHGTGDDAQRVPLEPRQALTVETAIEAYTTGSAYANGIEDEAGSIAVGKLADLVLLDQPILGHHDISEARPALTLVDGQAVYRAP